ncbi:hypothetical protein FA10DRAFT_58845 [Acaromyces ingoldii]|uniref:Uncharacterized protein n=1 Tax=Acaromyces ingoldii TaxID=215250 RepID=A0A316YCQ9_9BASI|nr:hypothetical protein FA10DRAFT_58845 [Acaromyces ingoldii]PWN86438.1 hypothetical protein FA10DRAFT_58845 [Acaromyces ingoldii]
MTGVRVLRLRSVGKIRIEIVGMASLIAAQPELVMSAKTQLQRLRRIKFDRFIGVHTVSRERWSFLKHSAFTDIGQSRQVITLPISLATASHA